MRVKKTLLGGFSRDMKVSWTEFCTLVRRASDGEEPILATRKQGRGLGARKRRARQARLRRNAPGTYDRIHPWHPRKTISEWLTSVGR